MEETRNRVMVSKEIAKDSIPVWFLSPASLAAFCKEHAQSNAFLLSSGFGGKLGEVLLVPHAQASFVPDAKCAATQLTMVLVGVGQNEEASWKSKGAPLFKHLPAGNYHIANKADFLPTQRGLMARGSSLAAYAFERYRSGKNEPAKAIHFFWGEDVALDADHIHQLTHVTHLVRDMINTPACDMLTHDLEAIALKETSVYGASVTSITGEDLQKQNFPMIYAVGKAGDSAPRLVTIRWRPKEHAGKLQKIALVGKGICYDTGGLDLKPSSSMRLMKKDMGGAAHVLALGLMIMKAGLPAELTIYLPLAENSVSSSSFRPGDILSSRKGTFVEIDNTDAEGRLVLADALCLADEEEPDFLLDMATLTGAARTALGPELPPFYTQDDTLAQRLVDISFSKEDPLWRMPLWKPYVSMFKSSCADLMNGTPSPMAGSIIAALFLKHFVEKAKHYVHVDIYGWNASDTALCPIGGTMQGVEALFEVLRTEILSRIEEINATI